MIVKVDLDLVFCKVTDIKGYKDNFVSSMGFKPTTYCSASC